VRRLKSPQGDATLLDVGCCVGQVLRQLAFEGVDTSRLYGTDIESHFVDIGYDLFKDRGSLKATFVIGDVLKDGVDGKGDERLHPLSGKMSMVHVSRFFHLFGWDVQVEAARRIVQFLRPDDPDAMIFGLHVGTIEPGLREEQKGSKRFLHNSESWQQLWDVVGKLTGTSWKTTLEPIEQGDRVTLPASGSIRGMAFGVYRA
jgi:SAM-dependent methyltransferase